MNLIFVVSGPSGVGKDTLVQRVLQALPDIQLSVSCTTRLPRPGEVDGRDYRFMTRDEFLAMATSGSFDEWAEYNGYLYGTPRLDTLLEQGDVVLVIEVQGALNVFQGYGARAHGVFICPPSLEVLEQRLIGRDMKPEDIPPRLDIAKRELGYMTEFESTILNDDLDTAEDDLLGFIISRRRAARPVPV